MEFSLSFFKSKKREELRALKVEEQKLKNKLLEQEVQKNLGEKYVIAVDPYKKETSTFTLAYDSDHQRYYEEIKSPYMSVKLVNDVLIVVLHDGTVLTKPSATKEDFSNVSLAKTIQDVLAIVAIPEIVLENQTRAEEDKKFTNIQKGLEMLNQLDDFDVRDNSLYIKGTNRSMPELLVNKFLEIVGIYNVGEDTKESLERILSIDEQYMALKKFWLKCCLNPSAQSAEDLYTFLSNHQFKIDKHGNFYAYRRVVKVYSADENRDLVDFISNTYNKVKAVWKQKAIGFEVYKHNDTYTIHKSSTTDSEYPGEWVGNLDELYTDLPNMKENRYTDQHTHSFDYRVGKSTSMPRHMGDDNNQISCSKGFHAASMKYDYSEFGDTPILMIINPIDVLAVPLNEVGKLRVCRWFFAMPLPEDEKYILEDDEFDVTDLGDIFEKECMTNLTDYVQTSFAEEVKRHTFAIPQISATELSNVVNSLEKMKEIISKRVTII
jgi:hypothetical protein